jgi:outer membrane protein TolC
MSRLLLLLIVACAVLPARLVEAEVAETVPVQVADRIVLGTRDAGLRLLILETLERNPEFAVLAAEIRVARLRPERSRGLPDPTAMVTAFVQTPETRVGPQRLMATVGQVIPWSGKRALAAEADSWEAEVLVARLEARRVALVTEVRRLFQERAFVIRENRIMTELRGHLVRHEEISRSSYTAGRGSGQGVLKLQAEITRVDRGLLELERQRRSLEARLNGLRDRPDGTPLPAPSDLAVIEVDLDRDELLQRALALKPELREQEARLAGFESEMELARLEFKPGFQIGLTYTMVDPRSDMPGRLQPPPDNGKDVFGIQAGLSIPLWKRHRTAATEEIAEKKTVAESGRRQVISEVVASIGDLAAQVELSWRELQLLEGLLIVQAEEARDSAQAAYVAGAATALELFDAEHVLFEAMTAIERARTDYLVALAEIEGVVGASVLPPLTEEAS